MAETDSSGALAQTHHQDAFGNTQASWSTGLWGGDKPGWHHNTKEYDADIGLVYMYSRFYNAETGTFGSRAPYRIEIEHQYSFTAQTPVNAFDPTGEEVYACSKGGAFGDPGLRHAYAYDDSGAGKACGRAGSSGSNSGDRRPEQGNRNNSGPDHDDCAPLHLDPCESKRFMDCMCSAKSVNKGLFVPVANDCFTSLDNCLSKVGAKRPYLPGGRGFPAYYAGPLAFSL